MGREVTSFVTLGRATVTVSFKSHDFFLNFEKINYEMDIWMLGDEKSLCNACENFQSHFQSQERKLVEITLRVKVIFQNVICQVRASLG